MAPRRALACVNGRQDPSGVSRREVADPPDELVTRGIAHREELCGAHPLRLALVGRAPVVVAQLHRGKDRRTGIALTQRPPAARRPSRPSLYDHPASSKRSLSRTPAWRGELRLTELADTHHRPYRCPTCLSARRWRVRLVITNGASTKSHVSPARDARSRLASRLARSSTRRRGSRPTRRAPRPRCNWRADPRSPLPTPGRRGPA
jgi:hypothetical protein